MIKKLLALLIVAATFGFANAATGNTLPSSVFFQDSIKAEQQAALTQVDFDEYYENLIDSEKNMIRKATTMSIVSGAVTGFGIFTTVIAFSGNNEHKNDWIDTYKHSLQIAGIGLTAAGIFGLSYNLYTIITKTGNNSKRASYERAYEIYKRRRSELKNENEGAKVILTPTVDLLGASAGLNLNVLF